jgi:hypothetical protein
MKRWFGVAVGFIMAGTCGLALADEAPSDTVQVTVTARHACGLLSFETNATGDRTLTFRNFKAPGGSGFKFETSLYFDNFVIAGMSHRAQEAFNLLESRFLKPSPTGSHLDEMVNTNGLLVKVTYLTAPRALKVEQILSPDPVSYEQLLEIVPLDQAHETCTPVTDANARSRARR